MQLRRLRLKNIRSYTSAELELTPGTTLIAGDVGSGKTSLLYAIEMALFGFAEVDAGFLVRHGAPQAEVAVEIEHDGHHYEISRRFRRITRKGRHSFELERSAFSQDGATTQYSATELRQRIIDLFGFPDNPSPRAHSDLWRWAVYVPQERMREVLSQEPQDRLETIRKALGVERYRAAAENAQELASEIRRVAATRAEEADRLHHWEADHSVRSAEIVRLRSERAGLETKQSELHRDLDAADRAGQEVQERLRRIEGDRREQASRTREHDQDLRAVASLMEQRRRAATDLERLAASDTVQPVTDLAALRERAAELDEEYSRLNARLRELSGQLQALAVARAEALAVERRYAEAREHADVAQRAVEGARAALAELATEGPSREPPAPTPRTLSEIDAALARAHAAERTALEETARARTDFEEVDSLLAGGICPRCRQAVRPEEFRPHREESARALADTEGRLRGIQAERESGEEERRSRERYERARDRWIELQRRRTDSSTTVARCENEHAMSVAALRDAETGAQMARERVGTLEPVEAAERAERAKATVLDAERTRCLAAMEQDRRAEEERRSRQIHRESLERDRERIDTELGAIQLRVAERATVLSALRERLERAAAVEEEDARARQRLAELQGVATEIRAAVARTEARIEDSERRLGEADAGLRERRRLLGEIEELRTKAAWVGGPFRETLFSIEERLLASAQAMFDQLFARYFASLVDDPGLEARVDVSFTPAVLIQGEWTPAEALSGGERTSLALAFRLALGRVVRTMGSLDLETIILDEPTDGFSPEQIVRMGELLEELALPQVVLVSHEAELASIADRVVLAEKHDGVSVLRVSRAESPGPTPT
ncbi:MAG: SMC family ATPase [Thermoplasmata archaeon]